MNKNTYVLVIICMCLISSTMSVAGLWDWVKTKIVEPLYYNYNQSEHLCSRIIGHKIIKQDGKKFEEFRCDISRDTALVKQLRQKWELSGIYISDNSDGKMYKEYIRQHPVPKNYTPDGFIFISGNTIKESFCRLLGDIYYRIAFNDEISFQDRSGSSFLKPAKWIYLPKWIYAKDAWIQLLWELEDLLPKDYDSDETGRGFKFLDFFQSMLLGGNYPPFSVINISPEWYKKSRKILLIGIPFWIHYTKRFKHNKALLTAYKELIREQENYILRQVLDMLQSGTAETKWASDVIYPFLKEMERK